MEPDLIKNSMHGQSHNDDEEFGPNFKRLRMTDNVRELQTVLRDKYVHFSLLNPAVLILILTPDDLYRRFHTNKALGQLYPYT